MVQRPQNQRSMSMPHPSTEPIEPLPATEKSPFEIAWDQYKDSLQSKKKNSKQYVFIQKCAEAMQDCSGSPAESVNEAISAVEEKHSETRFQRVLNKYVVPVVNNIKALTGVVDMITSSNTIASTVWGCLKVVIDCVDQYTGIFESIKTELESLNIQLVYLLRYKTMYPKDDIMQRLLCRSYTNVIRFWHRVHKECNRHFLSRSKSIFSTKKIGDVITDMKHDNTDLSNHFNMLSHQDSWKERQDSGEFRLAQTQENAKSEEERRIQHQERQYDRFDEARKALRDLSGFADDPGFLRHQRNLDIRSPGTCEWLLGHSDFVQWWSGHSTSPVLWLHGSPGCGKSFLCSTAINSVQSLDNAVAFHFCDFAQSYTTVQTLSMLAVQLLHKYWDRTHEIPLELRKIMNRPSPLDRVQDLITYLVPSFPQVFFFLDGLDEETSSDALWRDSVKVIHFLVGLTKTFPDVVRLCCSSQHIELIGQALYGCLSINISSFAKNDVTLYLSKAFENVEGPEMDDKEELLKKLQGRVECSFIFAGLVLEELRKCSSVGKMKELVETGLPRTLGGYYRDKFSRWDIECRPLACKVYALVAFAKRPLRMSELYEAIWCLQSNSPSSLCPDDKPTRKCIQDVFFNFIDVICPERVEDPKECDKVCRLFHSTLRDFLVRNPDVLKVTQVSSPSNLPNLSATEPPMSDVDLRITPETPAKACLFYLNQARYSELLTRPEGRWVDKDGGPVESHSLLVYAAKYWDKHLDDVEAKSEEYTPIIESFIKSPNFQTCVQVQSLWVEGQFNVYSMKGGSDMEQFQSYLRRVFPTWFTRKTDCGQKLWKDYRRLMREWKYFLSCENCANPAKCDIFPYLGQLNRMWLGALGSGNFLSQHEGFCKSFSFDSDVPESECGEVFFGDSIGESGNEVLILRTCLKEPEKESSTGAVLHCTCETWSLSAKNLRKLSRTQTFKISTSSCNWDLYTQQRVGTTTEKGRAPPAAFSPDGQTLRIGTRFYMRSRSGDFKIVDGLNQIGNGFYAKGADGDFFALSGHDGRQDRASSYVEEFTRRGSYIALATRTRLNGPNDKDKEGKEEANKSGCRHSSEDNSDSDSDCDEDSEDEDSGSEYDSLESSDDGDESGSEASTVYSEDFAFEDDMINPWSNQMNDLGESDDDDNSDVDAYPADDPDSDVDSDVVPGEDLGEDDEDFSGAFSFKVFREEDDHSFDPNQQDRRTKKGKARACITIYRVGSRRPKQLFRLKRPLKCKLFNSPPVFHPTKSLVVWPLADGDVLFIDYDTRKYFFRRLRPSTYYTGHVFMKIHFSQCGKFMHIAALEAKMKYPPYLAGKNGVAATKGTKKDAAEADDEETPVKDSPLELAMLVSTYRLSERKATRSPPTLTHRIRIALGQTKAINVSTLPITVTWAAKDLYVTCSDSSLRVLRVPLFSDKSAGSVLSEETNLDTLGEQPVWQPKKPFFLPETAAKRKVYYFPPTPEEVTGKDALPARILIGGDSRPIKEIEPGEAEMRFDRWIFQRAYEHVLHGKRQDEYNPPVGCYLSEEEILGGWVNSYTRTHIAEQLGVGVLDLRLEGMERFNPEDDCDLEPYIY